MKPNAASRWLDLVAYLLSHHFAVSRESIFSHVGGYSPDESGRRKFERDKDALRSLGIEIETVSLPDAAGDEPGMGYRLKPRHAYLPAFELEHAGAVDRTYAGLERIALTNDELEMLDRATRSLMDQRDTPFSAAAASARRKLAFDLPLAEHTVHRVLALPVAPVTRESLATLQSAVIDRVAVRCTYFTMSRQAEEERVLEPWGLIFQWARWYCVARAHDRDEPRTYRVDRMRNVTRLREPGASFTVPHDFDVRSFTGRAPWEFGPAPGTRAVVRFRHPESGWVVNRGVGELLDAEPGTFARLAFDVREADSFLRWILSFGRRAEVEEPADMAAALEALRADVAARYAEDAL